MNATECIKKISSSWSEKYRPTKLSDIAASDSIITFLTNCVNRNELPNLLLYGRAGVGKGSIINVLIKNLPTDVLYCDCSLYTGIDFIRENIQPFANAGQLDKSKIKVIVLNEADRLSSQAMDSLKQSMEDYDMKCRFIFACNRVNKIAEPIRSRCINFEIKPPKEKYVERLLSILEAEKVDFDETAINVMEQCYPDMRKALNTLYSIFLAQCNILNVKKIKEEVKYSKLFEIIFNKNVEVKELIEALKSNYYDDDIFSEMAKWFLENKPNSPEAIIAISEGDYRSSIVYDKDLNIYSTILTIRELTK